MRIIRDESNLCREGLETEVDEAEWLQTSLHLDHDTALRYDSDRLFEVLLTAT